MTNESFHDFVKQRQISDLVMRRLAEHVYDRPLINNVERADYVECLVELVMKSIDPRWRLTESWDPWDIEHPETGARLEIKQSSALQSWRRPSPNKTGSNPRFDISPHDSYWWECPGGEFHMLSTEFQRYADVYVFAWHSETDQAFADHRQAAQWHFFVVDEHELPPNQKSIGLRPLHSLVEPHDYRDLAEKVTYALPDPALLKAKLEPPPEQCPQCRPT